MHFSPAVIAAHAGIQAPAACRLGLDSCVRGNDGVQWGQHRRWACLIRFCLLLLFGFLAAPLAAHPVPFSYLDVHLEKDRIDGTLSIHIYDIEHELGIKPVDALLDHDVFEKHQRAIGALIAPRLSLSTGKPVDFNWTGIHVDGARQAVILTFRAATAQARIADDRHRSLPL